MRQLLRQGIESLPAPLPGWIQGTFRYLRHPRVRARRRVHRRILGKLGSPGRVSQGPFQGMRYIPLAHGSEVLPKLVGTYERELAWIPTEGKPANIRDRIVAEKPRVLAFSSCIWLRRPES